MEAVNQQVAKFREERAEREKARIEKLRQLNLKKYKKDDEPKRTLVTNKPTTQPKIPADPTRKPADPTRKPADPTRKPAAPTSKQSIGQAGSSFLKPNAKPNMTRPEKSGDGKKIPDVIMEARKKYAFKEVKTQSKILLHSASGLDSKPTQSVTKLMTSKNVASTSNAMKIEPISRKSIAVTNKTMSRKSMVPICTKVDREPLRKVLAPIETKMEVCRTILPSGSTKIPRTDRKSLANPTTESVFERLYKPKISVAQKPSSESETLRTDPKHRDNLLKKSGLIKKRQTLFEPRPAQARQQPPARRSISAVHFKRISKNELSNCMHKWGSIGDNIDKVHLRDLNEDHSVKEDKIISAVKSERKKVTFQKPMYMNFNTPRPEELRARLQGWLRKRGKSLNSYQHLQCFGLHHMPDKLQTYDDDNKENIAVDSDSDNESFGDNMNNKGATWRAPATPGCASFTSSPDVSCGLDQSAGPLETPSRVVEDRRDELLAGALDDLTALIREGYSWSDSARWLRAVRARLPAAATAAAYWECRAALEEARGDLPAALTCWEEAVAKGTESSVVEANLEPLLDKFMKLNISAAGARAETCAAGAEARRVDVRNVFKSTIIRFAVQQAKLRHSQLTPCTVTPVRRSARLSRAPRASRTPLHASLRDVDATFVNNAALPAEP